MLDKHKQIVLMRLNDISIAEIALHFGDSKDNINRMLSIPSVKEFRKEVESGRNSRKNESNGRRVQRLMTTVISSVEAELDKCTTDDATIALLERVASLSRLVGTPEDIGDVSALQVVHVPETQSIEEFNADTLKRISTSEVTQKPQGPQVTPGGSEIPARPHISKIQTTPILKYKDVEDDQIL